MNGFQTQTLSSPPRHEDTKSRLVPLCLGVLVVVFSTVASAQSGGGYTITKSTIDGGGSTNLSDGQVNGYRLGGTVGQPDAAEPLSDMDGVYELTGGFWGPPSTMAPPTIGDNTCQSAAADTGIPCNTDADCTPPAACGNKSRYITVTPGSAATAGGVNTSIQVEIVSMPQFPARVGEIWWAGVEQNVPDSPNPGLRGAPLVCSPTPTNAQVWTTGHLHLFGTAIVPNSTYNVRMCSSAGGNCSDPLLVATAKWGDVVRAFGGGSQPNFGDVNAIVQKFSNLASAPSMPRADLVGPGNSGLPNTPNQAANFADISNDVSAFSGFPYPFTVPTCP